VQAIIELPVSVDATNVQVVRVQNGCVQPTVLENLEYQFILMLKVVPMVVDGRGVVIGRVGYPRFDVIEVIVGLFEVRASVNFTARIICSITVRVARYRSPPEEVTKETQLVTGGAPFPQHPDRLFHPGDKFGVVDIVWASVENHHEGEVLPYGFLNELEARVVSIHETSFWPAPLENDVRSVPSGPVLIELMDPNSQ
jgi:hypothetical protein